MKYYTKKNKKLSESFSPLPDTFYVIVDGERRYLLARTESKYYDITNRQILADGIISNRDGLVPRAKPLSDEVVSELVSKYQIEPIVRPERKPRDQVKRRASNSNKVRGPDKSAFKRMGLKSTLRMMAIFEGKGETI